MALTDVSFCRYWPPEGLQLRPCFHGIILRITRSVLLHPWVLSSPPADLAVLAWLASPRLPRPSCFSQAASSVLPRLSRVWQPQDEPATEDDNFLTGRFWQPSLTRWIQYWREGNGSHVENGQLCSKGHCDYRTCRWMYSIVHTRKHTDTKTCTHIYNIYMTDVWQKQMWIVSYIIGLYNCPIIIPLVCS